MCGEKNAHKIHLCSLWYFLCFLVLDKWFNVLKVHFASTAFIKFINNVSAFLVLDATFLLFYITTFSIFFSTTSGHVWYFGYRTWRTLGGTLGISKHWQVFFFIWHKVLFNLQQSMPISIYKRMMAMRNRVLWFLLQSCQSLSLCSW